MGLRNRWKKLSRRAKATWILGLSAAYVAMISYAVPDKKRWDFSLPGYVQKVRSEEVPKKDNLKPAGKKEKYALLLNSGEKPVYPAFYKNITTAYKVLRNAGYSDENIIVLNENGDKSNGRSFVDYAATYENMEKITGDLSKKIDGNDEFFMLVSGHGNKTGNGLSVISLRKGEISESKLEKMLKGITGNAAHSVFVFGSCFSGGFAERFGKGRNVAIAVCRKNKIAYTQKEVQPFIFYFFNAYKNKKIADLDKNGKVSLEEAFDYAAKNDRYTRSFNPLLKSTPQLRYGRTDPSKTYLSD